jgi:hypothetical protein
MTDDLGQILLLSALVSCACLITLAACLYSVDASYSAECPALQREALDNVVWVQDAALTQAAGEAGGCQWEQRTSLADSYKSRAYLPVSSIEKSMIAHGVAYSFAFNESLATDYLDDSAISEVECVSGILIKKVGDNASVCGCAYDMSLADGSSRYHISTVKIWA